MLKNVLILVFLMLNVGLYAQPAEGITDYKAKLSKAKTALDSVKAYNKLAKEYAKQNFDTAFTYAYKAVGVANKATEPKVKQLGYNTVGVLYFITGAMPDSTIKYFNLSLAAANQPGGDAGLKASALLNLASTYANLSLFEKSLGMYLNVLKIRETENNPQYIGDVQNNIGIVLTKLRRNTEAITYFDKALTNMEKAKFDPGIMSVCINHGALLNELGKTTQAREKFTRAIGIAQTIGDLMAYTATSVDLAIGYYRDKDYTKAKAILLPIVDSTKTPLVDYVTVGEAFGNLGMVYTKLNKLDSARYMYNQSIAISTIANNPLGLRTAYGGLSETEAKAGNYAKAYEYLLQSQTIADTLYDANTAQAISNLKIGYEVERKEQENLRLQQDSELKDLRINQQRIVIVGLVVLTLLILLGVWLFYRQSRTIAAQREELLEQKLLQLQLNPHFIFNALQAIQEYIYSNNTTQAGQYIAKFAKLMRLTLENSREERIPLQKEVELLDNYLALQQLRLGQKLNYTINVAPGLNADIAEVQPMLIQPFVENAVEHGAMHATQTGVVNVTFQQKDNNIVITIADNGPGITAKEKAVGHQSLSTQIIKERLALLSKRSKQQSTLNIYNIGNTQGTGTQVEIVLPI